MARSARLALSVTFILLATLSTSVPSATQQLLSIGGYQQVSELRVTRSASS